jgi:lipoprotein-releasing system ATP-binding protein
MDHGIECQKITAFYRQADGSERCVLKDIDGRFPAGRVALISGPVGAGKSTLLHILAGLQRPTSGEVIINGQTVSRWIGAHRDRWRRQAGIVFQLHHLISDLTVFENVILPLIPYMASLSECRRRVSETLRTLELNPLSENHIHTLSGGERQKVAIARAMVNRPAFIFADEPTAHQDAESAERVLRVLAGALDWGAVVVLASHDAGIERIVPDRDRYLLKNGELKGVE